MKADIGVICPQAKKYQGFSEPLEARREVQNGFCLRTYRRNISYWFQTSGLQTINYFSVWSTKLMVICSDSPRKLSHLSICFHRVPQSSGVSPGSKCIFWEMASWWRNRAECFGLEARNGSLNVTSWGFPESTVVNNNSANTEDIRDAGSIPESRSRKWQCILVFFPGKFHGQGSLGATIHGVEKNRTQLSTHTQIHIHTHNMTS